MKTKRRIIALLILMTLLAGCFPISYDGAYKGKVVDAETRQPLEGVVVLGVWYSESATAGGTVGKYYDAQETVTDKKGEFEISGQGWTFMDNIFSSVSEMHELIFKAGYEYIGPGPWDSFKISEIYKKKISWEGDRAIIPLRKLTMEERTKQLGPPAPPDEAQKEKIILMLKEINKDRSEQGLDSIDVGK